MSVKGWNILSFPILLSRCSTARDSGCCLPFPCTSLSSRRSLNSHWHPGGKREEVEHLPLFTLPKVSSRAEKTALILSRTSLNWKIVQPRALLHTWQCPKQMLEGCRKMFSSWVSSLMSMVNLLLTPFSRPTLGAHTHQPFLCFTVLQTAG